MKRKIVVLGLCLLLISGCGSKIPALSNGDEAVVQFENGDMISVNDLYEQMKNSLALQTIVAMADKHILEIEYASRLAEAQTSAADTVDMVVAQYGDDALSAIQYYTGYQTMEAYQESMYISFLQNLAVEDYAKAQITDKQIDNHYKNVTVGDIKVSHILIIPEVTDEMTEEEKTAAEAAAKKTVETIIADLKKVAPKDIATKFAQIAQEQSADTATSADGGDKGWINKETLDASYGEFAEAAYKLKDGEFTTSVVTSELGYHVILRVESKEKAKLETLKDSIIETLAINLRDEDATIAIKAMQDLRKKYGFELIDSELKTQYSNYIQTSLANAEASNKESN